MHKARAFFFVCAGIFLLALAYHLGARSAGAQAPTQVVRAASAGRWTIVNGTPEFAMNIMLLDTATGDVWLKCSQEDGTNVWCKMPRTDGTASTAK
jgi:hypothetical protein